MWRILTTVSAEPDQEGNSRDARENRNGYFMIRGDYIDINTNKKGSPMRSETSKVTGKFTGRMLHSEELTMSAKNLHMLSLTTMLSLPTFQAMKLTENTILVTGFGRRRTEAFHALGNKVIIVLREP